MTEQSESRGIEPGTKDAEFEHEAGWFARAEREADRADEYGPSDV